MGLRVKNIWQTLVVAALLLLVWSTNASRSSYDKSVVNLPEVVVLPVDSPEIDLPYPIQDGINPFGDNGRINLTDPNNVDNLIEYDPETGKYYFYQRIGNSIDFKNPTVMDFEEYMDYINRNSESDYWKEIRSADALANDDDDGPDPFAPSLEINNKVFDRIFGGNTVDIRPQGTAELTFGANVNKNENPRIPVNQRSITTFNFDQRIQLNVVGNIGEKLKLTTNYNTEATFDFENQTKIEYTGTEDEIIQKIEAGNVSMPLSNSLISGSQSLFGVKTELKFGRLTATALFSQERGQKKEINVEGGAQTQDFEFTVDNYEANRHYFLSGYFRAQYDNAMRSLPTVNSGAQITRIEVWVVNQTANVEETRNVIGFTDLGEDAEYQNPQYPADIGDNPLNRFPDNSQNQLYSQMAANPQIRSFTNSSQALSGAGLVNGRDFERLSNARQLTPGQFTYNSQLGFISLNQALNNAEVLAVAYQYTLNGQTYQVGDLSNDGFVSPDALYLKLLKSTVVDVQNPLWDLMMKNVYSLGAFQVNRDEFLLNVWYNDPQEGVDVPVIPEPQVEDTPLLQILELDKLDQNQNPTPDGRFDFVDQAATQGGTINAENGRIYFPVIEPFGSHLRGRLEEAGVEESQIERIVYPQLYDSTKIVAQQNFLYLNRFKIRGSYRSASSDEISLDALNIPDKR
ncbi:MAG: cell surface protein SprA [Flavobacteriales bacterium]|nr:cell surface protein SprA [Flavobacteriales bacterium]